MPMVEPDVQLVCVALGQYLLSPEDGYLEILVHDAVLLLHGWQPQ